MTIKESYRHNYHHKQFAKAQSVASQPQSLIELLRSPHKHGERPLQLLEPKQLHDYEFSLYHIKEVTFDEESPRKEAFENVLNAMNIDGVSFVYLLLGDKDRVYFSFGIARDKRFNGALALDVDEIAQAILKPSLEGNFRGSVVEKIGKPQRCAIKNLLAEFSHVAALEGVPSVNEDNEQFQGVDRLVDIMSGDQFCLMVMADPMSLAEINAIENELYSIYDKLAPLAKKNLQTGNNNSKTVGTSTSRSNTKSTSVNDSVAYTSNSGKNDSVTKGTNRSNSNNGSSSSSSSGTSQSRSEGTNSGTSESKTKQTSSGDQTSNSTTQNDSTQEGESSSTSIEFTDKHVQEWLNYIDEVLLKRLQHGKNKGLYLSNIYLFANSQETVIKLGNSARAIYSGGNMNKSPLTYRAVTDQHERASVNNLQFPAIKAEGQLSAGSQAQQQFDLLMSNRHQKYKANWLSTEELSVVAGLPQKEVVGLALKEEVEFGLNLHKKVDQTNQLFLGHLVKSGIPQDIEVAIDRRDLDKHTFIAGVTGSGKTTTCHRLLESAKMPFLVVEPAKTEYRVLTKKHDDILIFTLGNDNVAPFRLNPFEFFPHENITSRVDMIKASIESAFEMEAAIPQLIEAAIYQCYQEKGWNIATSQNRRYADPYAAGVYAFPTLSDLLAMTEKVVGQQNFDDRLKQDYIGSIKARLQGLLIGAKGLMLDTPRSINFKDLAKRNVILELEEIRNPSEKSLIIGFVLANLNEAIRANYEEYRKRGEQFRHITLIEEAHRLLAKFQPGDSQNKKQGVETFADMLAEVRKYGESLIIVDQIPNKLTPEVLKNTNTKIIHKLFAQDDKEAVGNTMALNEEQMNFLSNLEPGRVILSSNGIAKPLQVQIKELVSTTTEAEVEPQQISRIALEFYAQNYQSGLVPGMQLLTEKPTPEQVKNFISGLFIDEWRETVITRQISPVLVSACRQYGAKWFTQYLLTVCQNTVLEKDKSEQQQHLLDLFGILLTEDTARIGMRAHEAFLKMVN
ncbi:helicase HerA domain-containing protein [Ferrimonas senticii]|uniref:helicase HerA domain-containing protein n=1 Tax=Ferrimonas senticii TaxID=394566 RepID=UPI0004228B64|nr:DUF87 domain-containing protein [Ferrimonas senticii]